MIFRKRRDREHTPTLPPYGTFEFARWFNGDVTKFCGHGYHEDADHCQGVINTAGITAPCLCPCHVKGRERDD